MTKHTNHPLMKQLLFELILWPVLATCMMMPAAWGRSIPQSDSTGSQPESAADSLGEVGQSGMDLETIRNWAQTIATVVAIIAAALVYRQLRVNYKQLRINSRVYRGRSIADLYSQQQAMTRILLEHEDDLRPYFYGGVEPTQKHSRVCALLAEKFVVSFELLWLIMPTLPDDLPVGWINFMRDIYAKSPAIRAHVKDYGHWYDKDMLDALQSELPTGTVVNNAAREWRQRDNMLLNE